MVPVGQLHGHALGIHAQAILISLGVPCSQVAHLWCQPPGTVCCSVWYVWAEPWTRQQHSDLQARLACHQSSVLFSMLLRA